MRIAVIFNPSGAEEETEALRTEMEIRSIDASIDAEWVETTEADPGSGQSRRAVDDGAELVIAVGGDGTVRSVAEGTVGSGVPLAVIPAGTGNLLAGNLQLPDNVEEALDIALQGSPLTMDVGVVEGEIFTVMSGAGIDAAIMEETSGESKDRLGVLAYVVEGAKRIFDRPFRASFAADDEEPSNGSWATILVGNLGQLQGGIDLFPDSSPHDGLLDLVGLASESPLDTIAAGVSAATESETSDRLVRRSGRVIKVEFESPTMYELDGDPRGEVNELVYEVRPSALVVMVKRTDR
ncbi:MAG: diacylglycerol kinase family protein [Acidimicrobiia bacterium]